MGKDHATEWHTVIVLVGGVRMTLDPVLTERESHDMEGRYRTHLGGLVQSVEREEHKLGTSR